MDAVRAYEEVIKDNNEYAYLIQDKDTARGMLDEIVALMFETVCIRRKVVRIAGNDYPAKLVKSKFMKLNNSHIQFVIDCMHQNTTKIRNIKKYLLAVLFNAPNTIDSYYTALVAHDMANGIFYHRKRQLNKEKKPSIRKTLAAFKGNDRDRLFPIGNSGPVWT